MDQKHNIQPKRWVFNMLKSIAIFAITICSLGQYSGLAQTIIWSETFPDNNGVSNDPSGEWTSTCSSCTFSDANDYFHVLSNAFRGEDMDGQGVWLSRWVDISAYTNVSLSLILSEYNTPDTDDSISASYSVDGGANYIRMSRGAYYDDFNGNISAVAQDINADSVQIRVLMFTNGGNDEYGFDDVYIVEPNASLPGSGLTLDFDDAGSLANADVVELDDNFPLLIENDFTVAAWINSDNVASTGQRIFCHDELDGSNGFSLSLGDPGSGMLRFYIRGGSPVSLDVGTGSYIIASNEWYHVAMTHNASTNSKKIYVNGTLAASQTYTGSFSGTPSGRASIGGEAIQSTEVTNHFNGEIDEVSIWTSELSQTQIRNLMCAKLVGNESNLLAYYRFDDGTGHVVRDETGNYPGGMVNMDVSSDWVTSGASIGDISTYSYSSGAWTGVSIYLQSAQGDSFQVNTVSGNPQCVHIYHVNQIPNSTTNIAGLGGNSIYYGVFHANGTLTTYNGTYHYGENDQIQASNFNVEEDILLFERDNNADPTWSSTTGVVNLSNKTITVSGVNTEFILGNSSTPLPVELLNFDVKAKASFAQIYWSTATETNSDFYEIERSTNGLDWQSIGIIPAANHSLTRRNYEVHDNDLTHDIIYYQLTQYDIDGAAHILGVRQLSLSMQGSTVIYPNPSTGSLNIYRDSDKNADVQVFNVTGQLCLRHQFSQQLTLDLNGLANGHYKILLTSDDGSETFSFSLIK